MHETIIANQIIEEAKRHGNVKAVTINVGDLAHLPSHELEECLKKLVEWKITVTEKKAKVKCSCGYEGEPKIIEKGHDSTVFQCPKCGNAPDVLDGDKIIIKEVEVED